MAAVRLPRRLPMPISLRTPSTSRRLSSFSPSPFHNTNTNITSTSCLRPLTTPNRPFSTIPRRPMASTATATASATTHDASAAGYDGQQPFFTSEPAAPKLLTAELPGPKSKAAIAELEEVFDTRALSMIVDYGASIGNYIADPDGNVLLDVFAQIASIPVGYNNPHLLSVAKSDAMASSMVNRPALGSFPQHDWAEILKTGILKVAPKGMNQVVTGGSGAAANELAYQAACLWKRRMERGGPDVEFTENEIQSSMNNQSPGSPDLSILSFKSAFHGRLFATLSTTRSKPIHKLDIPAFDWPQASFPACKYPLEQHAAENAAEEQRCLDEVEHLITTWHAPPAAVVVEPIQSEGGDNHASPAFFHGLRKLTRKHNILFIVDEVQTGIGATGKFWAHEHWNLQDPPDMVTFSKKAQTAGYYYGNKDLRPNKPYRQYNTWMGDPSRAILFRGIIDEIARLNLVENAAKVGDYIYGRLEELANKYPNEINNLRGKGQGTFIAWDSPRRDEVVKRAKSVGINLGGCGDAAVRLRPMLIFQKHHADIFINGLEKIIKS